jgi:hypothetical protein
MATPVSQDFAEIARRIREIAEESKGEQPKQQQETPQISPAEQEDSAYWGCFG